MSLVDVNTTIASSSHDTPFTLALAKLYFQYVSNLNENTLCPHWWSAVNTYLMNNV